MLLTTLPDTNFLNYSTDKQGRKLPYKAFVIIGLLNIMKTHLHYIRLKRVNRGNMKHQVLSEMICSASRPEEPQYDSPNTTRGNIIDENFVYDDDRILVINTEEEPR